MIRYLVLVTVIAVLAGVLIARYRKGYLSELVSSFFPYIFGSVLFILLVLTFTLSDRGNLGTIMISASWILLVAIGWPLAAFAFISTFRSQSTAKNLRVVSFNKLFSNEDLEGIMLRLQKLNANVAGVLELTAMQNKRLSLLAKQHKLYFASHRYSYYDSHLALLSRHKLQNVRFQALANIGVALVANVTVNRRQITIVLVHTAAPVIPTMLAERNQGLVELSQVLDAISARSVVVMGDFNLTPWSSSYKEFMNKLNRRYYNSAKGKGLHLTWTFFGPIGAQIDHILVSQSVKTKSHSVIGNLGSDHKLITADLKI